MTVGALALLAPALLSMQGTLQGTVRSTEGDRPVAYAQVEVVGQGLSAWTDDNGRYTLEGLTTGRWGVRVAHPNHDSLKLEVLIPDRGLALDLTLRARPGSRVEPLSDFMPMEVEYTLPALLNTEEIMALTRGRYPQDLADAGKGGESVLRLWLDERGQVVRSIVARSSGHERLDAVARDVARRMRFRPAKRGDIPMRVIVQIPLTFNPPRAAVTVREPELP